MMFKDALQITENELITFVGAGGKTSGIIRLARELKDELLVTTTTHFCSFTDFSHQEILVANRRQLTDKIEKFLSGFLPGFPAKHSGPRILVAGREKHGDKIKGLPPDWISECRKRYPLTILVEGDGAARKPIKAPAEYEPVVPQKTDLIVPVLGMSVLGMAIDESRCHRCEYLSHLAGTDKYIDGNLIVNILTDERAYGLYSRGRRYLPVLNQVTPADLEKVRAIAGDIKARGIKRVIITDLTDKEPVLKVI